MSKKFVAGILAGAALFASASLANAGEVKVGTLTCISQPSVGLVLGSVKVADCLYNSFDGTAQEYTAKFTRVGPDLGVTGSETTVWSVVAPGSSDADSLRGTYVGASAEAAAIVGVGVNALVGGLEKSVALQPVSASGSTGLRAAVGVTSLTLTPR